MEVGGLVNGGSVAFRAGGEEMGATDEVELSVEGKDVVTVGDEV